MSKILVNELGNVNGTTGATIDTSGNVSFSQRYPQTALLVDTKSQNTAGGTFTAGAWQTKTLNTEVSDLNNICSLSSNIFTLSSGTYLIEWISPAYSVDRNQSRLYDTTNSAAVQYGSSQYTESGVQVDSVGSTIVVISSNTGYKIEHRAQSTRSSQGFGVEANVGPEIYTQVKITKLG